MRKLSSSLVLLALSTPAFASFIPVPEPGVLELAGIGIVAAVAVGLAKKRRKK